MAHGVLKVYHGTIEVLVAHVVIEVKTWQLILDNRQVRCSPTNKQTYIKFTSQEKIKIKNKN